MPKDISALDQMKDVEEKKKKYRLLKVVSMLKTAAKNVQEWKEICNVYLNDISEDEKEKKQIIDWINSLDDVQITDDRKQQIKNDEMKKINTEKKKVDEQLEQKPDSWMINASSTNGINNHVTLGTATTSATLGIGNYTVSNAVSGLSVS
jgi:hypothetical protein